MILNGVNPPEASYITQIMQWYRRSNRKGLTIIVSSGVYKPKIHQVLLDDIIELKKLIIDCGGNATLFDITVK